MRIPVYLIHKSVNSLLQMTCSCNDGGLTEGLPSVETVRDRVAKALRYTRT